MTYPLPQYQDYLYFRQLQQKKELEHGVLLERFMAQVDEVPQQCCIDWAPNNDDGEACPECGGYPYDFDDLAVACELDDLQYQITQFSYQAKLALYEAMREEVSR